MCCPLLPPSTIKTATYKTVAPVTVAQYRLPFTMAICLGIRSILWSKMKSRQEAVSKLRLLWTPEQEAAFSDLYAFLSSGNPSDTPGQRRLGEGVHRLLGTFLRMRAPTELKFGTLLETVFLFYALGGRTGIRSARNLTSFLAAKQYVYRSIVAHSVRLGGADRPYVPLHPPPDIQLDSDSLRHVEEEEMEDDGANVDHEDGQDGNGGNEDDREGEDDDGDGDRDSDDDMEGDNDDDMEEDEDGGEGDDSKDRRGLEDEKEPEEGEEGEGDGDYDESAPPPPIGQMSGSSTAVDLNMTYERSSLVSCLD